MKTGYIELPVQDQTLRLNGAVVDIADRYCPFSPIIDTRCGSWCPHFNYDQSRLGSQTPGVPLGTVRVRISCTPEVRKIEFTPEQIIRIQ